MPPPPLTGTRRAVTIGTGGAAVGRKLANARRAAGLSQEALGQAVGVSKATISMMECGLRTPKVDLLVLLAAALGVPPHSLLPDSDSTAPAAPEDENAPKARAPRRGGAASA